MAFLVILGTMTLAIAVTPSWWRAERPGPRVGMLWSSVFLLWAIIAPSRRLRVSLVSALVVLAGLTLSETYLAHKNPAPAITPGSVQVLDDLFGYRPTPSFVSHASLKKDGAVVYQVTYTTDENGLRLPPKEQGEPVGTVLCFVDSFMWGDGLNDDETTPFQIGTISGGRYRVYNFAFSGYGPHQMLRAFDSGTVARIVKPKGPVTVLYLALPSHVARMTRPRWDAHGPRYTLGPDGRVFLNGHFDDDWFGFIRRTITYEQLIAKPRYFKDVTDEEVRAYGATLVQTREAAERLFPGSRFEILWADMLHTAYHSAAIEAEMKRQNLRVWNLSRVWPDYDNSDSDLHQLNDLHPSRRSHELLARFLVEQVLPH